MTQEMKLLKNQLKDLEIKHMTVMHENLNLKSGLKEFELEHDDCGELQQRIKDLEFKIKLVCIIPLTYRKIKKSRL